MKTMTRIAAIGPDINYNVFGDWGWIVELKVGEDETKFPRVFYILLSKHPENNYVGCIDKDAASALALRNLFKDYEMTHSEERKIDDGKS